VYQRARLFDPDPLKKNYGAAPSNYVTPITSAKEKPPSHPSGWRGRVVVYAGRDARQVAPTALSAAAGQEACVRPI